MIMGGNSGLTVVLVHGGFVDGAGWEGVYNILKKDGYNVSIVQNPTTSLADDVAATRGVIARAQGPVVLVGHSYGGLSSLKPAQTRRSRGSSTHGVRPG
jgi:pimeloyl-ACP methyl ester carboxylesterase